MIFFRSWWLVVLCGVGLLGCRSAYYSFWEEMGKDKRDLLRDKVTAVRDEEKDTREEIVDALETLRITYGSSGSELEKAYDRLKGEFEEAQGAADTVEKRIADLENIATDLFREWQSEAETIGSAELRNRSRTKLSQTRRKYEVLHASLMKSQNAMRPVLSRFRDHVLFLKHSLNAQALGTLEKESRLIQMDVEKLIQQMNTAIAQSDSFLAVLQEE